MTQLLIDGDILAYIASANCEAEIDWGGGDTSTTVDIAKARREVDQRLEEWLDLLDADSYRIALSTSPYFRHTLYPAYKGHRKTTNKPAALEPVKAYLRSLPVSTAIKDLEADDILGIWGTDPSRKGRQIIVSIDKDLLQIPGEHYNPRKVVQTDVTLEQGDAFFYQQCLTGDPTDGFAGLPGIGPVKAKKLLDEASEQGVEPWVAICSAYLKKGLTEADALLQARLARILRWGEYDFHKKEVVLWNSLPQLA